MIQKLIFSSILSLLFMNSNVQAQQHKVVIQLTSGDSLVWKATMNNVRNLKKGWGDDVKIEVVVHGPGIGFLITDKTTEAERIKDFSSKGVVFVACENTLRERKIPKETLLPGTGYVEMGVGEIILKQEQGWSYLKAGF